MAELGELGKELQEWQAAIIHDLGGEDNISASIPTRLTVRYPTPNWAHPPSRRRT